jgi:hypothetical protein
MKIFILKVKKWHPVLINKQTHGTQRTCAKYTRNIDIGIFRFWRFNYLFVFSNRKHCRDPKNTTSYISHSVAEPPHVIEDIFFRYNNVTFSAFFSKPSIWTTIWSFLSFFLHDTIDRAQNFFISTSIEFRCMFFFSKYCSYEIWQVLQN